MLFRIKKNTLGKFIVEYKRYTLWPFWTKDVDLVEEKEGSIKTVYNWTDTKEVCQERVKELRENFKPYKEFVVDYCDHN